jgi:hypothetical protein
MNVRILVFWSRLRAVRRSILRTIFLAELVLAINLFPFSNSSARYRSESAPRQGEKSREEVKRRAAALMATCPIPPSPELIDRAL